MPLPTTPDPIERRPLGSSEIEITALGLGTAPFASIFWDNTAERATATAARGIQQGIRLFDTAPFYGLGEAEERLGGALEVDHPDDLVIATKVGRTLVTDETGRDAVFDFSYDATMRSLDSSLSRLGVDRVHILHVHDPEDHLDEALAGTFRAASALRQEGVIAAVSVGTNVVDTARFFVENSDPDCVLVAGRLTLLDHRAARALLPICRDAGVAYLAAGVFNSGVLARPEPGAWYDYAPVESATLERVEAIRSVCSRHEIALTTAAVHFPFTHQGVTAEIIGMGSPDEVDANIVALRTPVPDDLWSDLVAEGLIEEG